MVALYSRDFACCKHSLEVVQLGLRLVLIGNVVILTCHDSYTVTTQLVCCKTPPDGYSADRK